MSLEQNTEHHHREVVDKYVNPNADFTMRTYDYQVRPSADAVSGAITLTLPPVADAKGRFYSIVCRNADGVNTVTVTDNDDSECWLGDIVFDGKCDKILLYSDGMCWHALGVGGPGAYPGFDTTAAPGTTQPPTTAATTEPGGQTTAAPSTAAPTTAAPTTAGATTAPPTTTATTT